MIFVISLTFVLIPVYIMKYVTVSLIDGNTGELIYETKATAVDTSSYLRSKINTNVNSFCNYFRDHPGRDIVFQVSVREQRKSLVLFDDVY